MKDLIKKYYAISIVCHEIGHAIQHAENYKPLEQRNKIVNTAWITSIGKWYFIHGHYLLYLQQELQA